jgi:DNA replication protein DnaC
VDKLAHLDGRDESDRLKLLANIMSYDVSEEEATKDMPAGSNLEALGAAHLFVDNPRGWFYVWGSWGNAKTDMLMSLLTELGISKHIPGLYITFAKLVSFVREAYEEREAYSSTSWEIRETASMGKEARIQHFINVPLLAIDEFDLSSDKVSATPWLKELVWNILDPRHKGGLAGKQITLFASNSPPSRLPGHIASRMNLGSNVVVEITAPDMRPLLTNDGFATR